MLKLVAFISAPEASEREAQDESKASLSIVHTHARTHKEKQQQHRTLSRLLQGVSDTYSASKTGH